MSGDVADVSVGTRAAAGLDLLSTRRSPLLLRPPGPDGATLRAILQMAMCGPDHGRLAPWRFIVIEGDAREAFGRVLCDSLRRRVPDADDAMLAREAAKALRAPTIVVVAAQVRAGVAIPAIEQQIAAGIAAYNLLLAAHAFGLAGMWRTGATAYDAGVRRALGLDDDAFIVAFLYLGTPDATPRPRAPVSFEAHVRCWSPPGGR
ncbi:MAG TPA: nitroreductase [Casimicrobiaceae bacterium]|nr:nitroreductase [Casimicrobiaceae bacterium]